MNTFRKFSAIFVVLCMMLFCVTAFAADLPASADEVTDVTSDQATAPCQEDTAESADESTDITPRQSIGRLLAGGCANFYGDGTLDVYLDSGNAWADIQAGTGPSSATGSVNISVKFPDGEWYDLGTILANASHTIYNEFTYCPKGIYHFVFENSTNDWIQVYANIYD